MFLKVCCKHRFSEFIEKLSPGKNKTEIVSGSEKFLQYGHGFFSEMLSNIRVPNYPNGAFRGRKTLFSD